MNPLKKFQEKTKENKRKKKNSTYNFNRPLTQKDKEIVQEVFNKTQKDFGKTIKLLQHE